MSATTQSHDITRLAACLEGDDWRCFVFPTVYLGVLMSASVLLVDSLVLIWIAELGYIVGGILMWMAVHRVRSLNARRLAVSYAYCAGRGWDPKNLTRQQILTIMSQPEWDAVAVDELREQDAGTPCPHDQEST